MELPKKTISISQIRSFYFCPKCWYLNYYLGLKMPEPEYFTFGKKVHKAIEMYHKGEYKYGQETDKYIDIYREAYPPKYDEIESYFEIPIINPLNGKETLKTKLNGIIDKINEGWIEDHKTASKLWSQKKLDDDIQMTIYSYAYRKIYNKKERGIRVNVLLKRANPALQTLDTFRVLGDYIEMYNFIMKYIHDVKNLKEVPEHGRYCKVKSLFP
jgi:CRISPR/Cas system-associated exonuclease Cas4 (RecB family)